MLIIRERKSSLQEQVTRTSMDKASKCLGAAGKMALMGQNCRFRH
jgi:hypothetical protein